MHTEIELIMFACFWLCFGIAITTRVTCGCLSLVTNIKCLIFFAQWLLHNYIPITRVSLILTLTDPCALVFCANGHRCEVFEPTGEAFCNPDCDLNNGGCPADQDCQLQKVVCVRAPCPPIVQCVEKSNKTQTECPPTCSKDFCSKNRRAMCSK